MKYKLVRFSDLSVGQTGSFSKTVTEADIGHFVAITGDVNPLHVNEEFASSTFFGSRIAHGMLSAALFSTLVGQVLPGVGSIYRSQSLDFLRPVRIGDTLTATFEITSLNKKENLIHLDCAMRNQKNQRVIIGKAVVSLIKQPD